MPHAKRSPLAPPKECRSLYNLYKDHITNVDSILESGLKWISDFETECSTLDDMQAVYVSKTLVTKKRGRKKRISESKKNADGASATSAPLIKKRTTRSATNTRKRTSRSSLLVIAEAEDADSSAAVSTCFKADTPAKPPRRAAARLASQTASKKITQNLLDEKRDPAKLRYVPKRPKVNSSDETESDCNYSLAPLAPLAIQDSDDHVQMENDDNDENKVPPTEISTVSVKDINLESIVVHRLTDVGPLTPTLAFVPEDESPPALKVSSAVFTLSSNKASSKKVPLVTCTPLNMNTLSNKRTSRGTYCLSVSLIRKLQAIRKSGGMPSDRRRSSVARHLRRSHVNRVSNALQLNKASINEKTQMGEKSDESEARSSHHDDPHFERDEESDNGADVPEAVPIVVTRDVQRTTRPLSVLMKRRFPSTSKWSITPIVGPSKLRSRTAAEVQQRSVKKISCGRSSGYSSSDGRRMKSRIRAPQLDSAKQSSAQRLRLQAESSKARKEAMRIKEEKFLDSLKKHEETVRQKIELKKKKREERVRKAMIAREEKEKQKMLRLKEQEDEVKRHQAIAQKKREQEEYERQQRAAEHRRINELRLAEKEREKERERKLQAEAEMHAAEEALFMREERQRELERARRELGIERQELEIKIRAVKEQERREQRKLLKEHEKQRALAEERLKKEAECNANILKVSVINSNTVVKHPKPLVNKPLVDEKNNNETQVTKPTRNPMNTTVTLVNTPPPAIPSGNSDGNLNTTTTMTKLEDPNNYSIGNLQEEDSSEDENHPKKRVPVWAEGRQLKWAGLKQYRKLPNYAEIFPKNELWLNPDLSKIFQVSKSRYYMRTSSANWSSSLFRSEIQTPP